MSLIMRSSGVCAPPPCQALSRSPLSANTVSVMSAIAMVRQVLFGSPLRRNADDVLWHYLCLRGTAMEVAKRDMFVMMRLDHGDDILSSVAEVVKRESSTLLVVTGLGMISDFELGYFDRGNYIKRAFDEPHELLALQGSVANEGGPRIHTHATRDNRR